MDRKCKVNNMINTIFDYMHAIAKPKSNQRRSNEMRNANNFNKSLSTSAANCQTEYKRLN